MGSVAGPRVGSSVSLAQGDDPVGADRAASPDASVAPAGAGPDGQLAAAMPRSTASGVLSWAWAVLAVVYAWVVAGFAPFSLASSVAVFVTGAVVLVVAFGFTPPRVATAKPLTKAGVGAWAAILGAFSLQEVLNFTLGSTRAHPTLSILVAPLLEDHLVKAVAVLIWLGVGWVLVRR